MTIVVNVDVPAGGLNKAVVETLDASADMAVIRADQVLPGERGFWAVHGTNQLRVSEVPLPRTAMAAAPPAAPPAEAA